MKKVFFALLCFSFFGCENVLQESAKKDTRQAVYYEAKKAMDRRDYATAITLMQTLGPTFLAQRDVATVYASAYSGRCGLDFVNLLTNLDSLTNAGAILGSLMLLFPNGTDAKITDCVLAEGILQSFGDHTQRNADENILMGLSSLTKVGTVLSRYADTDADGITDGTFDHCSATDLPDSAVGEVGTGIALSILSVSSVASDISANTFAEITDLCALDPNLSVFCTVTDKNNFTALQLRALRAVIGSSDFGISACTGDFLTCICP